MKGDGIDSLFMTLTSIYNLVLLFCTSAFVSMVTLSLMGKVEIWRLLLFKYKYFDRSFTEIFLKQAS